MTNVSRLLSNVTWKKQNPQIANTSRGGTTLGAPIVIGVGRHFQKYSLKSCVFFIYHIVDEIAFPSEQ